MKITNHRLQGVKYLTTPNSSGNIKQLKYIICHDDEGASMAGTESWIQNKDSQVSYHVLVGKKGEVTQFVDFNKRAYHAGKSSWKGLSDLNWYSVGVAMQNRNKEPYTPIQIDKYIEVCKAIKEYYGIDDVLGHKEVSPGRKTDPHNGFPMDILKTELFGKNVAKKTISNLNLRKGAGTTFAIVTTIPYNSQVEVLQSVGNWSEVRFNSLQGWVNNHYLN